MQTNPYFNQQPMFMPQQYGYPQQYIPQRPQPQMPRGINGKFIQTVESITANDVPMDGTAAFFPMQDMSAILVKSWNADGTIRTSTYKPSNDAQGTQTEAQADTGVVLLQKLDDLYERLELLNKSVEKITISSGKKER